MKRKFLAPPAGTRCKATISLRDGSGAQCMRREAWDGLGLCWQHQRAANKAECDCQNPEPKSGVALVSNGCPVHNLYPER